MRNGAHGFLLKPVAGDQLLAIVRSVLGKGRGLSHRLFSETTAG